MPTDAPSARKSLRRRLITEPRRPVRIRESPRAAWFVVAAVCVGAFMGQLDASIVTVALPRLGASLHAGVEETQWASLSYLLMLVCVLIPVGHMADRVGRKLLYVYGFGVFTLGSGLCAAAPTLGWLIAARVVQALGAAMLQANSVALIRESLPRERLGRAIGYQGAAQALGLASGPAIGGALLALGSWRLLFLVNLPAGCVGIVLGWLLVPRSVRVQDDADADAVRTPGSDRLGAVLLAVSVGGLMLGLSLVPHGSAVLLLIVAL
jgi:MFS family permease